METRSLSSPISDADQVLSSFYQAANRAYRPGASSQEIPQGVQKILFLFGKKESGINI